MNRKHSTRESAERMLRSAVEAETPDVRAKIMASLGERGEETSRCAKPEHRRRVWKYAAALALAALTVTGALTLPKSSVTSGPAASAEGTASGSGDTKAIAQIERKKNPFTLVAYAAEKGKKDTKTSRTNSAGLALTRPVSVTGIDCSNDYGAKEGRSIYDTLELLGDDGTTQLYARYVGFNIKCVGEKIKSVTFTAARGGFAQIKSITQQEHNKIYSSIPYVVEQEKKRETSGEKPTDFPIGEPNPDYGNGKSLELVAAGWGDGKGKEEINAFLPVGSSYTVSYQEQDDYRIQYALRLPLSFSKTDVEKWDQISMKELFHRASKAMDETVVTVTANYEDSTKASKQCVLKLDPETWIFHAVEK